MIPHGVGKCHVVTKGTGSRQELAVSNANRLRDYSGSLEKGAGREFTSGLRDLIGSLEKGDSPRCGEMSRSDKGDGLPSGAGREFASGLRDYSGSLVKGAGYERSE